MKTISPASSLTSAAPPYGRGWHEPRQPEKIPLEVGPRLEAVTAAIAGLMPKCIATIVELANGPLILNGLPRGRGLPALRRRS